MRRREFVTLLGTATAWPLAVRAQQSERQRHIGVLLGSAADDPEGKARLAAFLQALQQLGWSDGRNIQILPRFTDGETERACRHASSVAAYSMGAHTGS